MSSTGHSLEQANALTSNADGSRDAQNMEPTIELNPSREGDEQALESHEVIELQAFIERKAWIEEKIKILEKMPPIEVFVGLDAIRSSATEVPGLPSRAELRQWLIEHDAIEKETEIFDAGEMKKLKKFTKAAAHRNLSPEDTDLIELTLNTIFDLDKLMHLLRDRSENLDLLDIRLTWEEYRVGAWSEVHKVLQDVGTFLDTRAKWTPSVYESFNNGEEQPFGSAIRRGSVASTSSAASITSESSINSIGFSRGARFKLAEQLTREASHLSGRMSGLRYGQIAAAGKALDKLIDSSRKSVPDELLDEQDRLEEKGINDLEEVGRFVINVVAQWRKADELYVETMKDKASVQNLVEEVETAKLRRPNAAHSLSFTTRIDKLKRRLALREVPHSPKSTFPCPVHSSFPSRQSYNESLVQTLSTEIHSLAELVLSADSLVQEYNATAQVVQRAETLIQSCEECASSLTSIIGQLETGVPASGGDGIPPSLSSETALQPSSHSAYLALLPSLLDQLEQGIRRANKVLSNWSLLSLQLDQHGIDSEFRVSISSQLQDLNKLKTRGQVVGNNARDVAQKVREARQVWSHIEVLFKDVEALRSQIHRELETHKWRRQNLHEAPITPPTPLAALAPPISSTDLSDSVQLVCVRFVTDVEAPLASLSSTFTESLAAFFDYKTQYLKSLLDSTSQLVSLLKAVKSQAAIMHNVRDDFDTLLLKMEELSVRQASQVQAILEGNLEQERLNSVELEFRSGIETVLDAIQTFTENLPTRVTFVSQHASPDSSTDILHDGVSTSNAAHSSTSPTFDASALDTLVRADCNSYAMRLNGELEVLRQKDTLIHLARLAKEVDAALSKTSENINVVVQELTTMKASLPPSTQDVDVITSLQALIQKVDDISREKQASISRSFSPIQELLRRMEGIAAAHDPAGHQKVYLARRRAVDDAEFRFMSWKESLQTFRETLLHAQVVEVKRIDLERLEHERLEKEQLEQQRLAEESRLQAEKEKALVEAAEKARSRRQQEEEEERSQLEEARRILQLERERFAADSAENHRLEQEHLATIERLRSEEARLREEHAKQVAEGRLAVEQAEKDRQEHERQASEKIRKIEEELQAEENRLRLEKARIAEEMARLQRETATSAAKSEIEMGTNDNDDVFGPCSISRESSSQELHPLQRQISYLRKRLRALSISEIARPSSTSVALPSQDRMKKLTKEFTTITQEVDQLPDSTGNPLVDLELRSLKADIAASTELMEKVRRLSSLAVVVQNCDAVLSDLLEHIDSYPALPLGILSSDYRTPTDLPPEAQLAARLTFTRTTIYNLNQAVEAIRSDPRALAEKQRILQTWNELDDMAKDRLNGRKSRPPSVNSTTQGSSGRSSRALAKIPPHAKKTNSYAALSVGTSKGRFLSPSLPTARRAVSGGSSESHNRSSSRLSSLSTNRSVSGPHGSLYAPTFASRQRTSSLSTSTTTTPTSRSIGVVQRARAQTSQSQRTASPSVSELSARPSRSSISGTWSRAPRLSLTKSATPQQKRPTPGPKKTYVPDPKSKLDVAVGDVVNNLPVNISIEGVAETWRDQSGKYWIGDQDPKLCFCRILRSHTVMVRVGGGWSELSKFIRDHFAESFRLISESPPRPGVGDEKWISSATLLEAAETNDTPPVPPRTPEPKFPFVPTFALSTPTGKSPQSVRSSPSTKGSPLTPLQFIRRAEPDAPLLRSSTPSKSSRAKRSMPPTPARHAIWRP